MKSNFLLLFILIISLKTNAQTIDNLRNEINQIISTKNLTAGVSIRGIENKDTLSINGNLSMPMMSVFKFHIALAVLNEVDKGNLKLNQKIFIKKEELLPDTWSPIREE